VWSVYAFMNVT